MKFGFKFSEFWQNFYKNLMTFVLRCINISPMRIANIPQMAEITIKMVHNDAECSVKTRVLTAYGDGILVTPITFGDQILDYCSHAKIEYKSPSTGHVHIFESDSIARTDFNGTDFHVIRGKELLLSSRMRKAERYMVQVMGQAVVNSRKTINVIVNDISMRGISLLIGKDQTINTGDELELSFFKTGVMKRITVKCKVVRLFKVGEYNAAGCVLSGINSDLTLFVAEKKREYNSKLNIKVAG